MNSPNITSSEPLYAVIDLGSNSFHMLITRQLANSVQIVDKVKRKVRLASGLDSNNQLSEEAMARGYECLRFFAERLQDIPSENVKMVATATLRIATNGQGFLEKANEILQAPVSLLTGLEEAEYIYRGVAFTSVGNSDRLVIDIGGASTELVVGKGTEPSVVNSLDIGCVTYLNRFFSDSKLSKSNFDSATKEAKSQLLPLVDQYKAHGWQQVLSGSGTMQALAEMLTYAKKPNVVSKGYLYQIRQSLIDCAQLDSIELPGLQDSRKPVLPSGLAILIAIAELFDIDSIQLSNGALREGLLYQMLPEQQSKDIRQLTVNSLVDRFHIDKEHALNVSSTALSLLNQAKTDWQLTNSDNNQLLNIACLLHEIGLLLDFKNHQQHGAYIIQHAQLPGFDQSEKRLIARLIEHYKGELCEGSINQAAIAQEYANKLLVILRLSVILCRRRNDESGPEVVLYVNDSNINLSIADTWLACHPLIADELRQEVAFISALGFTLTLNN